MTQFITQTTPPKVEPSLVEQVKQDIIEGGFLPNEKLVMARLKDRYKTGTGPLREVLAKLVHQGLVIAESQKGFRVKTITSEELLDIYESRGHLEVLCIRLAIERGNDEWEANIIAAEHRMKRMGNLEQKDDDFIRNWEVMHQRFHRAILSGCGLASLLKARQSLYEKCARYRNVWLKINLVEPNVFNTNEQEHDRLLSVIMDRDVKRAEELTFEHLYTPMRYIKQDLENGLLNSK
jgi:GntR family carbon starvation induced transcriptional regulator